MTLAEKLLAIHASLDLAGFEHAFGGAIALAYWTRDPRGTSDIDVNVFVPAGRAADVIAALPEPISSGEEQLPAITSTGQARVWWEQTPIDLFFNYERLHEEAARNRRFVPFVGEKVPVLGPVELAVFKAVFDRTRDWADIEAMLAAETLDLDAVRDHLIDLLGAGDGRCARLDDAARRAEEDRAR